MDPVGDAAWDVDGGDGRAVGGLGVEDDEVGRVAGAVVDDADEPPAVLAAGSLGVGDEDELGRAGGGTRSRGCGGSPVTRSWRWARPAEIVHR